MMRRGNESDEHLHLKGLGYERLIASGFIVIPEKLYCDLLAYDPGCRTCFGFEIENSVRHAVVNIRRNLERKLLRVITIPTPQCGYDTMVRHLKRNLNTCELARTTVLHPSAIFCPAADFDPDHFRYLILQPFAWEHFGPHADPNRKQTTTTMTKNTITQPHINAPALRLPAEGELQVDPEALRRARQGVPKGDLHAPIG